MVVASGFSYIFLSAIRDPAIELISNRYKLILGKSSLRLFLRGEYLKLERYEQVVFDYLFSRGLCHMQMTVVRGEQ